DRDGLVDLGRRLRHLYAQLSGRLRVNCSLLYRAGTPLVHALVLASLLRRRLARRRGRFDRLRLISDCVGALTRSLWGHVGEGHRDGYDAVLLRWLRRRLLAFFHDDNIDYGLAPRAAGAADALSSPEHRASPAARRGRAHGLSSAAWVSPFATDSLALR